MAGTEGLVSGLGGVGGLIGMGSSILGSLFGAGQRRRARKMLSSLKDPGYKIPGEYETNLAQSEQMAKQGLPSEQYNLAQTNIQRGTQAGLRQLGRMANPFAGISGLARNQSDALASLDAANAAARRQNILGAMGVRSQLAQQKLAQQQYSQQRYMDKVNEANALLGAGTQNLFGGLSGLGNMGMMLSGNGQQKSGLTMGGLLGNEQIPNVLNARYPSTQNLIPFKV